MGTSLQTFFVHLYSDECFLVGESLPNLANERVPISAGLHDPVIASYQTKDINDLLTRVGENVSVQLQNDWHELT